MTTPATISYYYQVRRPATGMNPRGVMIWDGASYDVALRTALDEQALLVQEIWSSDTEGAPVVTRVAHDFTGR